MLINYKRYRNKLSVQKACRYHNEVSKWISSLKGQIKFAYLLVGYVEKNTASLLIFLPKIHDPSLTMRTHQTNPIWGRFCILRGCRIYTRLQKRHDLKHQSKTEEMFQTCGITNKCNAWFWIVSFGYTSYYWDNG